MDVEVSFNPSKVFAEFREKGAEYVIALKLSSDKIQVRDSQSEILLGISYDYPTASFATSFVEVSVNKDVIPVSIAASLDYTIDGYQQLILGILSVVSFCHLMLKNWLQNIIKSIKLHINFCPQVIMI